ncbi:MAG: filamentous hemagglutinin N-terminal domain-containing protein [Gammaproteobacteria bacterium]
MKPQRSIQHPARGNASFPPRRLLPMLVGLLAGLAAGVPAHANPSGAQVVHGTVNFQVNGRTLNITNSPNAIINWQRFGIAPGEVTRFHQQSSASAVLNRVTGGDPSRILGALRSNGRVFLINPSGIVFGQGARIDTAGFIASTLNMSDEDFLRGNYSFAGGGEGGIQNEGVIRAGEGGNVILIAPDIENGGVIEVVDGGQIVLAAGKEIALTSWDNPSIRYQVSAPENEVLNLGRVLTDGGAARLFAGTVRHSGEIRANGVRVGEDGAIELFATTTVDVADTGVLEASGVDNGGAVRIESDAGVTRVAGTVDVSSTRGRGGQVDVFGREVTLAGTSRIEADGATAGGSVRVGGDFQGTGTVQRAERTTFERGALINASATDLGDGGRVIIWADDQTTSRGAITIRGGERGGDGGFAEVSGKMGLFYDTVVDASAAKGDFGQVLLDPVDGCISTSGTCTSAGFTGVTVASVEASAADYLLSATNDIEVENSISMSNAVTFTLQADNNITFYNNAVVETRGKAITLDAGNNILLGANSGLNTTGGGSSGADITLGATAGSITNQGTLIAGTGQISAAAGGAVHLGDGTNADFLHAAALLISGSGAITASSDNNSVGHFEATNNGDGTAITFVNDFLGTFTIGDVANNGSSAGSDIHISVSSGGANCGSSPCGMDITGTISANMNNAQVFLETNIAAGTTGSNIGNSGTGRIVGDYVQLQAHAVNLDGGAANQINTFSADVSGNSGNDDLALTYSGMITLDGVEVDGGDLKIEGHSVDCATGDCDIVLKGGVRNFASGGQTFLDTGGGGTITSADGNGIIEAKNLFLQTVAGSGQIGTDPSAAGGQSLFLDGTAFGETNLTIGGANSVAGVFIHQTNNTLNIDGLNISSPVRLEVNNNGTLSFGLGFPGGIDTGNDELFLSAGTLDLTRAGNLSGDSVTLVAQGGGITFAANAISATSVDIDSGSPALDLSGVSIQAQDANNAGSLRLATDANVISDAGTSITADSVSVDAGGDVELANGTHAIEHFSASLTGPGDLRLKVGNDLRIGGVTSADSGNTNNIFEFLGADGCVSNDCTFTIESPIELNGTGGVVRIDTGGSGDIRSVFSGPGIVADQVEFFFNGGTGSIGEFQGEPIRLASVSGSTSTSVFLGSGNTVGDVNLRHMGDKSGNSSDLIVDGAGASVDSDVRFEVDNGNLNLDPGNSGLDMDLGAGRLEIEVRGGSILLGGPIARIDAGEVDISVEDDLTFTKGRIRTPGQINLRVGGTGNTLAFAQTGDFFLCSGFDSGSTSCSGSGAQFDPFISLSADRMNFGASTHKTFIEAVDGEVAIGSATDNLDIRIVDSLSNTFDNALELTPEMLGRVGGSTRELFVGAGDDSNSPTSGLLSVETAISAADLNVSSLSFSHHEIAIDNSIDLSGSTGQFSARTLGGDLRVNADLSAGSGGIRLASAVFNLDGSGNGIDQKVTVSGNTRFGDLAIVDGTVVFNGPVDVAAITETDPNSSAANSTETVGSGALEMRGGALIANADFNVDGDSTWSGGTIGGTAAVDFGGSLEIIDTPSLISGTTIKPEAKRLDGEIGVDGKVRWSASDTVSGDGLFGLFAGSSMEISGNGTFNPEFNNEGGSISKTSSGTTTFSHVFDQRDANAADGGDTARFAVRNGTVAFKDGFEQESGSLVLDGGDIEGNVVLRGGELTGSGTIMGNLRNVAGTIAPGFSPGSLSITGDLILESLSKLILEIGGNSKGAFDQINVDGKATLGGEIIIKAINNFDIDQADGLSLLTAAVISGAFSAEDLPEGFELDIGSTGLAGSGADVLDPVTEEVQEQKDEAVEDAIEEVLTLTSNTQKAFEEGAGETFDTDPDAGLDPDGGEDSGDTTGDEESGDGSRSSGEDDGSEGEDSGGDDEESASDGEASEDEGDSGEEESEGEASDDEKSDKEDSSEEKDGEGSEERAEGNDEAGDEDSEGSSDGNEGSEDGGSETSEGGDEAAAGNDDSGQEADESEQDPELIAATSGSCGTN